MIQRTLGVVLAGGLSSRMKQDKASLQRNHQTMLEFSRSTLEKCDVDDIVISGSNYQVKDAYINLGPLAGIFSVIKQCPASALLIMPVDLPLITPEILMQLKLVGELSNKACSYKDHPLPLYLPVNSFVELFIQQALSKNSLIEKGPSIRQLFKAIPHQEINQPDQSCLFNTNTPEQWQQAQRFFSLTSKY
ncbi:molybdenum cofactor guanylyltransferase [Thalassotalea piscium]|uniref:Molybdopterin-guanine dinucleotide biosynthesis protein A n=1 Tax=Thalassotalea piscium TaxID=1230533 RepID=A0A7X0NE86_9GAMM|nr:molybdenum cofactor guanylyltransferase [Thalassotalea piscium]MBB6541812.1 molybdopterin-guanine dinucleotide biosynthesis protein A [Thalassotalea piscium]